MEITKCDIPEMDKGYVLTMIQALLQCRNTYGIIIMEITKYDIPETDKGYVLTMIEALLQCAPTQVNTLVMT